MTWTLAFQTAWLGEVASIGVMEIAMNTTDYLVGGRSATSVTDAIFRIGFLAALGAGYVCAYPVNFYMLRQQHAPLSPARVLRRSWEGII